MIIGIDPSITATGLAKLLPPYYDNDHEMTTIGRAGVTKMDYWSRRAALVDLTAEIVKWTSGGILKYVAIESGVGFGKLAMAGLPGERTTLFYLLLGAIESAGVPCVIVQNTTLKRYATGKGNANKAAMLEALVRRAPEWETKGNDNLVDAAWLAMLAADMIGSPVVDLPAINRAALKGLEIHK